MLPCIPRASKGGEMAQLMVPYRRVLLNSQGGRADIIATPLVQPVGLESYRTAPTSTWICFFFR